MVYYFKTIDLINEAIDLINEAIDHDQNNRLEEELRRIDFSGPYIAMDSSRTKLKASTHMEIAK